MDDAREAYLRKIEAEVRAHYDALAPDYARWVDRYRYYYGRKAAILRHLLPRPGRVLDIGCGTGDLLAALDPEQGLGIDLSEGLLAQARARFPAERYPNLAFRQLSALDVDSLGETFDTILLVSVSSEVPELVEFLRRLRAVCTPDTRIVQLNFNYLMAPLVRGAGQSGVAPRHPMQNWLTKDDLDNLHALTGYEAVRAGYDCLVPFSLLGLGNAVNRYLSIVPGVRNFALLYYSVVRTLPPPVRPEDVSVSVCVPCKNEEGNIDGLVARIPEFGRETEIIFVDDQSTDATAEKVRAQMAARPDRTIRLVEGPGENKGAACRAGFAEARNDVLMILDADMTVMPEDLPLFLDAIAAGHGEFINGSRLVYRMEGGAMRFANILGNKFFAIAFSFLLGQRLKDTLCGTKVVWRRDYPKLLESREHFGAVDRWGDYDWIFGAARHNLRIVELPVRYRERVEGETKMTKRLRNAMTMLRMCGVALRKVKLI